MGQSIQVLCHDQFNVISGTVRSVTDIGCELVSSVRTPGPVFAKKARVLLNILDEKSGKSMNVYARLTAVIRDDGSWVYRVQWRQKPQILGRIAA
ncbi:MAG: hypothetical protein A3K03_09855 [Bdellovibrionales bacterium RIFOXYD1_FULL_44_7]|nr:MAG: hypothetical protein A3K03_09855 [Bdellovibrionales bacterium RIFOXYD1_FULL_44_7]